MRGGFRARAEARSAGAVRGSRRAAVTHFHHIIDATSLFGWAFKLLADSSPEPACEVVSARALLRRFKKSLVSGSGGRPACANLGVWANLGLVALGLIAGARGIIGAALLNLKYLVAVIGY